MKTWNHYICSDCGKTTIARHDDEGVTPFLLRCRHHNCGGMAESTFFEGSQDNNQKPNVIFYRPAKLIDALVQINKEKKPNREWLLNHYNNGGSLIKEA